MDNHSLIDHLQTYKWLTSIRSISPTVFNAMRNVDRGKFIPAFTEPLSSKMRLSLNEALKQYASSSQVAVKDIPYLNMALPVGYDQTCPQPSVLALIADLLQLQKGMCVLEVGSGCGYGAAVLSELVGPAGKVITLERIAALVDLSKKNLAAHFGPTYEQRVNVLHADGTNGYADKAPYDRVVFTAEISREKIDLAPFVSSCPDGVIVFPEQMGPMHIQKYQSGTLVQEDTLGNFCFVPLRDGLE